jgi:hypothetical protein
VYYRGYDHDKKVFLGHNSYGSYERIVNIPDVKASLVTFYKVTVDAIIGQTDRSYFYLKMPERKKIASRWFRGRVKEYDGQNIA